MYNIDNTDEITHAVDVIIKLANESSLRKSLIKTGNGNAIIKTINDSNHTFLINCQGSNFIIDLSINTLAK